jgi:hypothetical protein
MIYLDPLEEYQILNDWLVPLVGKKLTPRNFVQRLGSFLNKRHFIRVKLLTDFTSLDRGDFAIGAEYDPDLDQAGKKQLLVHFIVNDKKTAIMKIDDEFVERFTLEMTETLVHEYQHQQQYRSRKYAVCKELYVSEHKNPEVKSEQEYMGSRDEIEAYAANIATRLYIINQGLNTSISKMISKSDSWDLKRYIKLFGKDHDVVKQLLSLISKNISYLGDVEDGKIRKRRVSGRPKLRRRNAERGWYRNR